MFIRRRAFLTGSAAFGIAAAGTIRARAQANGPIRVPMILSLSGPLGIIGENDRIGAQITADYVNKTGGIMGRKLEIDFHDDRSRPEDVVALFRDVAGNGSNIVIAGITTGQTLPLLPVINDTKTVCFFPSVLSLSITHELYTRYMFRCTENEYQRYKGHARNAFDHYPNLRRWGAVVSAQQVSLDLYSRLQKFLNALYAQKGLTATYAEPIQVKLGAGDFRSSISELAALNIDALFHNVVGNDAITFWQQARPFGLGKKIKLTLDNSIDIAAAKVLRGDMPPNLWSPSQWYPGLYKDNPISQALYASWIALGKDPIPPGYVGYGHIPVIGIAAGIKAANGSTDTNTFIAALEGLKFPSAKGDIVFRKEDHQMIQDSNYINVVPLDKDPGIAIAAAVAYGGAELVEPPSPGAKFAD